MRLAWYEQQGSAEILKTSEIVDPRPDLCKRLVDRFVQSVHLFQVWRHCLHTVAAMRRVPLPVIQGFPHFSRRVRSGCATESTFRALGGWRQPEGLSFSPSRTIECEAQRAEGSWKNSVSRSGGS